MTHVFFQLLTGKAEVFGTELAPLCLYSFPPGSKIGIFTWFGCTVRIAGETEGQYVSRETPMIIYANTHMCLERIRTHADSLSNGAKGPVTMIVGPPDVGKSTLSRILLNYAVRSGRKPIYVDLDVDQGAISVPGTIGSILVEREALADGGFSQEAPLLYNLGHASPTHNMKLYKKLIEEMAQAVSWKMESNEKIRSSGVVINTCGWVKEEGHECLTHIARCFDVDVILVLDKERLFNDLNKDLAGLAKVVYLPKSGGAVERSRSMRSQARDRRIRDYFYGSKIKYHPHVFDVPYSRLRIYKIGVPALPDSCMPIDMKINDHRTKLVKVDPSPKLTNRVLALSLAESPGQIINSNVAGFIVVLGVNEPNRTVSILSTQPKPLPHFLSVQTDILFVDSK